MDNDILKNHLNKLKGYIDGFDDGKYPILDDGRQVLGVGICNKEKWIEVWTKNGAGEGYNREGKKIKETSSFDEVSEKLFPSIAIEIDMGRKIGTNVKGNGEYTKLSIIVDYEGNIISAYPIYDFRIK